MVSLTSAENALKSYYLGVVANQLNTGINPLLARIRQTSSDVWGKEVRKMAPYGLHLELGREGCVYALDLTESGLTGPQFVRFADEVKRHAGFVLIRSSDRFAMEKT